MLNAIEITTLVLGIIAKVAALGAKLLTTGSGKTAEEVRQEIKDGVDECDDNWLEAEVKKADQKFVTPPSP